MTLDYTAKRYGVLPSQLLREGDVLDLKVSQLAVDYERYVRENPGVKTNHGLNQDELMAMLERAKQNA